MQYFQTLGLTLAYVGPIIPAQCTTHWHYSNDSNKGYWDRFISP